MILIANSEAASGIHRAAARLRDRARGLDAIVEGISLVERDPSVRSVGYGGWPNLLGEMEFDAGVMDGNTLRTGAVGALRGVIGAAKLACMVPDRLNHEILVGEGASRFAREMGFASEDTLLGDSRRVWYKKLAGILTPAQANKFPDIPLVDLHECIEDPERVRDTTVFLCRDGHGALSVATSTSGWAWKYPGRLGDAPICGAGFYADSRFGAAACTHTGEMTIRAGTARTVVNALRFGKSLDEALAIAVDDLEYLKTGYMGGVVIHALDAAGHHKVVNFRCEQDIEYWLWKPGMGEPELRDADMAIV